MRKLAIGLLALFRRASLLTLKLRGKTTADVAEQRVVSGQAWDEFCDTLKAAGAALNFPGAPRDPFNQAEGYRYLSRLARGGLMAFVEHADPRAMSKPAKSRQATTDPSRWLSAASPRTGTGCP